MAVEPRISAQSQSVESNLATSGGGTSFDSGTGSPLPQIVGGKPDRGTNTRRSRQSKSPGSGPGTAYLGRKQHEPCWNCHGTNPPSRTATATEPVDGLVAPVAASDASTPATKKTVIDLETVSLAAGRKQHATGRSRWCSSSGVCRRGASRQHNSAKVVPAGLPNTTPGATATSSGAGDDLPPLPADLGRSVPDSNVTDAPKTQHPHQPTFRPRPSRQMTCSRRYLRM